MPRNHLERVLSLQGIELPRLGFRQEMRTALRESMVLRPRTIALTSPGEIEESISLPRFFGRAVSHRSF